MDTALNVKTTVLPLNAKNKRVPFEPLQQFANAALDAIAATFFCSERSFAAALFVALAITKPEYALCAVYGMVLARYLGQKLKYALTGLTETALLVNGLFAGLSAAALAKDPLSMVLAATLGSALVAPLSIVVKRLLQPWNLRPLVFPYLLAAWGVWHLTPNQDTLKLGLSSVAMDPGSPLTSLAMNLGRSYSEIFFADSPLLGYAMLFVSLVVFKRRGLLMLAAALISLAVGYGLKVNPEILKSGILGFPGMLMVLALTSENPKVSPWILLLWAFVGPLAELVALRMAYFAGVPALSLSFLLVIWSKHLIKDATFDVRSSSWGSTKKPQGSAGSSLDGWI